MASSEQWRRVATPLTVAAAVILVGCCAVSFYSGSEQTAPASELMQLWHPHVGRLTEMVRSSRARGEAREQSLAEESRPAQEAHRGRTGHYANSWAQRMLRMGDSQSPAENSDKPERSFATRRYSNTHPHYTSDVRESAGSGEENAYNFANMLARQREDRDDRREMTQVAPMAREQELADVPASMRGPRTSSVREDRAGHNTRAWSFAQHLHRPALAQAARTHGIPETTSVREERTTAEQSAWDWASDYFRSHRHHRHERAAAAPQRAVKAPAAEAPKQAPAAVAPKAAAVAKKPAAASSPSPSAEVEAARKHHAALHQAAAAVKEQQRSLRARKLEAARRVREDLHTSTLRSEHDKFQQRHREEQRRVREIAAREAASEQAANEGAAAEFAEYGSIAAGGVPDGGASELSEAKSGGGDGDMQGAMARRRTEKEEVAQSARRVQRAAVEAKAMAKAEEQGYQKGYLAGVDAERKEEGEERAKWQAGAADRAVKRAKAEKKREEKEAQTQDLRDDTWGDADGDFQVDGGQWGPSSGDWA